MQRWTSILHQTISTTKGVRDQPRVVDVWIKLQVSRKPCFHTGPAMNNESTTNETEQHWPHSDRPAVSLALIHPYAFIQVFISSCCQIKVRFNVFTRGYFQSIKSNTKTRNNTNSRAVYTFERKTNKYISLYILNRPEVVLKHKTALISWINMWHQPGFIFQLGPTTCVKAPLIIS